MTKVTKPLNAITVKPLFTSLVESAMNLLRKSLASSLSLSSKPPLVSLSLSSLLLESRLYSVQATEFDKRIFAINNATEFSTVNGSLVAQRRYIIASVCVIEAE